MHVVELRVLNWLRYRGEHRVELGPVAYGVVARHARDDERSNWLGKTSFLNALRFALFGKHPAPTEDAWITRGEREGGVGLRLSDGTTVERRRERGKATRLAVALPDGAKSFGNDAQRVLDKRIGLTDADFTATCFFPQKQISRFVVARPAERMGIIAGWLQLEPLQRAEKRVRTKLAALLEDETKLAARKLARDETIVRILGRFFDEVHEPGVSNVPGKEEALAELGFVIADLERLAAAKHRSAELAKQEVDRLTRWRIDAEDARRYRDLMANAEALGEAKTLSARVESLQGAIDGAQAALNAVSGELRAHNDRKRQVDRLACGQFDGVCPVDGHTPCSDAAAMNGAAAKNRALAEDVAVQLATVQGRHARAKLHLDSTLGESLRVKDSIARRETMLEQSNRYVDAANRIKRDGAPPDVDLTPKYDEAWEAFAKADAAARDARNALGSLRAEYEAGEKDEAAMTALRASVATIQQAVAILGRNGAQRRLAEEALADITGMANDSLRDSGVELVVDVQWAREGQGLADECDACGAAFPKGRAAKECSCCGASRGPKTVERVEVVLSDTSGAAEDLAGVVIQLAAGAWLRARRDAPWSTACIDEPFGALDPTNKRALSTHLATLLRGRYGFEQAFVVAHDRGIMDAMPGRIVVEADDSGSRPTVA